MEKIDLLRRLGNMQQLAYARQVEYKEGLAKGLRAFEVKCNKLRFNVLADKCLDIGELSYKGVNFSFLTKPGLVNRGNYENDSDSSIRSIMGGFLFTCGLDNICAPCDIDEKSYPMHGKIRCIQAENTSSNCYFNESDYIVEVSGTIRQTELFGENLVLNRKISTSLYSNTLTIEDEIENQAFRDEALLQLYHINLGYPLIDESTEIIISTKKVLSRDNSSIGTEQNYNVFEEPIDNELERVYIHDLNNNQGETCVAVYNHILKLGLKLEFNQEFLPYFYQWKTLCSGDYGLALEPANASVLGRKYHYEQNTIPKIKSFEKRHIVLRFTILDGEADYVYTKTKIEHLQSQNEEK